MSSSQISPAAYFCLQGGSNFLEVYADIGQFVQYGIVDSWAHRNMNAWLGYLALENHVRRDGRR